MSIKNKQFSIKNVNSVLPLTPHLIMNTLISINNSEKEYLHPSVLWFCILEPYVLLRDATKRERLRFGNLCRTHIHSLEWGVNCNDIRVSAKRGRSRFGFICRNPIRRYEREVKLCCLHEKGRKTHESK